MKKLLYIILLLPLFGFGQLVSSGGALISNPYSYPVDNCVQALTTATATELIDVVNGINPEKINANCLSFNGDNSIDISSAIPTIGGKDTGVIRFNYKSTMTTVTCIYNFGAPNSSYDNLGIYIGELTSSYMYESISYNFVSPNGQLKFAVELGNNYLNDDVWHEVEIVIDGINNRIIIDSIIYQDTDLTFINGDKTTRLFTNTVSQEVAIIGKRPMVTSPLFINAEVSYFEVDEISIPFVQGNQANIVANVNGATGSNTYTIAGTVDTASWDTQDTYFYANNEGFSDLSNVELAVNGTFDTDLSGWISYGSGISWDYERVKIIGVSGAYSELVQNCVNRQGAYKLLYDVEVITGACRGVLFDYDGTIISNTHTTGNHINQEIISGNGIDKIDFPRSVGAAYEFYVDNVRLVRTDLIPASQLNNGYDTDGNILTNPPIENGLNGGCDIVYPNNATLEALDTDNLLYTVGGIPIELSISDLQANWNNQYFWNTDNSTYAKQGLIYSVPVESNPIDKYYDGKRYLIKF